MTEAVNVKVPQSVIPAAAAQSIEFPLSLSRWGEVLFALVD